MSIFKKLPSIIGGGTDSPGLSEDGTRGLPVDADQA